MSLNVSSWSIRHPIPTIIIFLMLVIFGSYSFYKIPINAEPSTNFPLVNVTITQSGASPDELENSVTRKVEDAVAGLAGVRHITSTITDGSSVTTVEFLLETDIDRAVNDVRDSVSQIRDNLPSNINNPIIERLDVEGGALAYYAITSTNMTQEDIVWFIDDTIKKRLLSINGVQKVQRLGGENREILVSLYADKINALGIDASFVSEELAKTNLNVPAGRMQVQGLEQSIRVVGSQDSVTSLANLSIALPNGRRVKLSEIARVIDYHPEIRSISRLNGQEVVGFQISRAKGSSDTVVAKDVDESLSQVKSLYPEISIQKVYSSVITTEENYKVAISTLLEGAFLTVLVVWLFLRCWRAALVAAIALPLSILPTFIVIYLLDYTLNNISLLAITLVIGILVDDAIVEIENVKRFIQSGHRPYKAALLGADAIGLAVIAITLCIVAVFLPVSFIGGMTGLYFKQFGITITAAVISSLLVARFVTPLLSAYMLPVKDPSISKSSWLKKCYLFVLKRAIYYRKLTILIGIVFFICSIALIPLLPSGFLPKGDMGMSQVDITLPPGFDIDKTDAQAKLINRNILEFSEVDSVFYTISSSNTNKVNFLIILKDFSEREVSQKEFEDKLRSKLSTYTDMRFAFRNEMAERDVSIILTGNDPKLMQETAYELKHQMQSIKEIENIQINAPLFKTELQVRLRKEDAAKMGVSAQAVGNMLQIATVGNVEGNTAKFNLPDRQIPIRVTLDREDRNNLDKIKHLKIKTDNEGFVSLSAIADISYGKGSASLERFDRQRRIAVEADLKPGEVIGSVFDQVNNFPIIQNLPKGVEQPDYGDAEFMDEMFSEFGFAMVAGIIMVVMILIILFNDFFQPFTILTALPLSIGGAILGLLLYGAALDMSSVIGILMLMGIVTKNSILLVDVIIEKRKRGVDLIFALVLSGAERCRPIFMTTIAMVAGMIPAVLSNSSGSSFRVPMAIAVICGLLSSTLLSLVFVPVFYTVMDNIRHWIAPKLARLTTVTEEDKKEGDQ